MSGELERRRMQDLLRVAGSRPEPIAFWWRDDDAVDDTPALRRLLELRFRHDLPLALAVVPKRATAALGDRLAGASRIDVLQHGWSHRCHSPDGDRKAELGADRPAAAVLAELELGFARLAALVPGCFRPVLVPPWNRLSAEVAAARRGIGLVGLSTFGPQESPDPHRVNTHVDIFVWKPERRPIAPDRLYGLISREIELRLAGSREPIGILTHHLVHDDAAWAMLDPLFDALCGAPGIRWPAVPELFRLPD